MLRQNKERKGSLATKLTLAMTALIIGAVASVTWLSLRREQKNFRAELEQQAEAMLDTLSVTTGDALYFSDVDFMEDIIDQLKQNQVVVAGRIYQKEGRIVADAYALAANIYNLEVDPIGKELLQRDTTLFQWRKDRLIAGKPVILGDEAIGAISISLSTSSLEAKIADVRNQGLYLAIIAGIIGTGITLWLSRSITEPLQQMTVATQRIAEGDLSQQITIRSQDELALLASAFNRMSTKLQENIQSLEQKAEDLRRSENLALEKALQLETTMMQLRAAKQAADTANNAKSQFLANMSHELRTPLNAILGFTQLLLRDRSLNYEQYEQVAIINRSGEQLLELINDVLDLSKVEAGRINLNKTNFNLHNLLQVLEEMLQVRAKNEGLQLIFIKDENVPQYIVTDERKLRQILLNLLGNALKFTQEGQVTLQVSVANPDALLMTKKLLKTKNQEPITLIFTVEDTGPGIAPAEIDSIFQAFVQTETGRQSQQGTGLGLAISQKFAQLMGGKISVQSVLGKGTIFRCFVQANVVATEPLLSQRKSSLPIISLASNQPQYRILIVEDKWENRQLLIRLLEPLGFQVKEAVNGKEGVKLWAKWQPHLILMDMQMPVMNGYQAVKKIKQESKRQATKIIALTASALKQERNIILSVGCDDYVRKPFRQEELLTKIEEHLGVDFLYQNPDDSSFPVTLNLSAAQLQPEDLKIMPVEWIKQLYQAATQVDGELILDLLQEIPDSNINLQQNITDLVKQFRFDLILKLSNMADK